jgi:hypothetical protein
VLGREVHGQYERQSPWAVRRIRLEIAYILRTQFRDRADVRAHLQEILKQGQSAELVALALFEPSDPVLDQLRFEPMEIGQQFSDWVAALHLASARSKAGDFVDVMFAMINRPSHSIWDFQEVTNRAVVERLQRDSDVIRQLKDKLASEPSVSEIASLPRYLSAAGAMDGEVHERCRTLLQQEAQELLLRAGYDAVDNSIRSVSRSLLELVTPSFSP